MFKRILYLFIVIGIASIINSCNKDTVEEESGNPNFIKVNNADRRDLTHGVLERYWVIVGGGGGGGGHQVMELVLLTKEFTVAREGGGSTDIIYSGKGYGINFLLYSSSNLGIESGTYQYKNYEGMSNSEIDPLTFSHDSFYLDNSGSNDLKIKLVSGTVNVINKGDNKYEFVFLCKDELGRIINGKYVETVKFADLGD